MWFWGSLGRMVKELVAALTGESINCPECGKKADYESVWGRFTEYRCVACGKSTKVKTYD